MGSNRSRFCRVRSDASNAAAVSGSSVSRSANWAGRCIGVRVRKVNVPEMSGCPSGVRIGMSPSSDWARAGAAANASTRAKTANAAEAVLRICYLRCERRWWTRLG